MLESGKSLRVLVADDERVIANTLAHILNVSGFEAKAVYSGEMALEVAGELKPDVLISDVIMTGMTGIEAAIHILEVVPPAASSCFPGRRPRPIFLKGPRPRGTASSSWPSPFILKCFSTT